MKVLRGAARVLVVLALAILVASYLGGLHPFGDTLAVARLALAAGVGVLALLARALGARRIARVGLIAGLIAALPILWAYAVPARGTDAPPVVTVYAKNLLNDWPLMAPIAADIRAEGADIVLLQEVTIDRGAALMAELASTYPHRHVCQFSTWSGIVVMSRWPLSQGYCSPHRTVAAARVAHPDGPLWAVSVHLVWPYPHEQAEMLDRALPFLQGIEGRAVVAGDFNMVPWGQSVRRIARATGTERVGPLFHTIEVEGFPLAIDHVYSNGRGTVARRPLLGSDHAGLVARLSWPEG